MATTDDRLEEKPPYGVDVDTEKNTAAVTTNDGPVAGWTRIRDLAHKAIVFGRVELRGVAPIPVEERTVDRTINIFTLWWSMNANILP